MEELNTASDGSDPLPTAKAGSRPSLTPSFIPASKETSRVITDVHSPTHHLGWHSRGYLPHWDHPGMIQSVNFRLIDSLPIEVLQRWKTQLFGSAGFQPANPGSRTSAGKDAGAPNTIELRRRIEEYLDAGHGACWLRRDEIAAVVEDALRHFDGQRYRLLAWCIMPNHVHSLIETMEGFPLSEVVHSWKSFTSKKANEVLGRRGAFWQREYLDRYVRNAEHYVRVLAYIEENPVKAGLVSVKTEFPWSSARFRAGEG
jgi:REP element-mobilizing transposase RayT